MLGLYSFRSTKYEGDRLSWCTTAMQNSIGLLVPVDSCADDMQQGMSLCEARKDLNMHTAGQRLVAALAKSAFLLPA